MIFDIYSWFPDLPPVESLALFKTEDAYPVFPLATLFTGNRHAGKSIYMSYAISRWKNGEEGFGLLPLPTSEIRPVCITLDREKGVSGIQCLKITESLSCEAFSQSIEKHCRSAGYNIVFIDDLKALRSHLPVNPSSKEGLDYPNIAALLSALSECLGIYIFALFNLSKEKGIRVADIQATICGDEPHKACRIVETTNTYVDLVFNWRSKDIKKRVMFGPGRNELLPEPESAIAERLEAQRLDYDKYGGVDVLKTLLEVFYLDGHPYCPPVRVVKDYLGKYLYGDRPCLSRTYKLIVLAEEDGYLCQEAVNRGSYYLSEKGEKLIRPNRNEASALEDFLYEPSADIDPSADDFGV